MRYDLRLLESFDLLARELHFGRAAERLSFAQPVLSRQIQRLEAQLGVALFTRDSRSVSLTPAGEAFQPHARASLAAAVRADEAVTAARRVPGAHLRLSADGDVLKHTRDLLRSFSAADGGVHVDVTLRLASASLHALARGAVDAAIVWSTDGPPRGFERSCVKLADPGAGIALRETHPLAALDEVPLDRLRRQRLVMIPRALNPTVYRGAIESVGGIERFSAVHHVTPLAPTAEDDLLAALDDRSVAPAPTWVRSGALAGAVFRPLAPGGRCAAWLIWGPWAPTGALAALTDHAHGLARNAPSASPARPPDPGA